MPERFLNVSIPVLIQTVIAFGIALGGGLLSALLARTHKQLCALISLGAGTLMGVTLFAIGPECVEHLAVWQLLLGAGTGYALFAVISKFISTSARPARQATLTKRPRTGSGRSRWRW